MSSLPTNANLARWRKIVSEDCSLCGIKQTQRHVVSFCSSALNNGRFTWRHNSVLYTIFQHLSSLMKNGDKLFADLIGFESTSFLFESSRPDACIVTANGDVLPLDHELTVCHELNFEKARDHKEKRYRDLRKDLKINCTKFEISFIEISALGFVPTSIKEFKKTCKRFGIAFDKLSAKCSETAIRTTYYIFNRRSKDWTNPLLMEYTI